MARQKRRSKPTKRRRSASQIALWVISLIIVLSMVIGFVISVLAKPAGPQTFATPTPIILASPASATQAPVSEGPATPQSDQ
jgi:ABC-type Fe3+ transport system permease subunit